MVALERGGISYERGTPVSVEKRLDPYRLPTVRSMDDPFPVHVIITMITWIQTSRLTMKNSLSLRVIQEAPV